MTCSTEVLLARNFIFFVLNHSTFLFVLFFRKKKKASKKPKKQTTREKISIFLSPFFFFTDLSAAGVPAELKHITKRRKRKQP